MATPAISVCFMLTETADATSLRSTGSSGKFIVCNLVKQAPSRRLEMRACQLQDQKLTWQYVSRTALGRALILLLHRMRLPRAVPRHR